jgi:ribosome biogenesis protein ENP2
MEEKPDTTLFDEYKFLTKEEMERLNLTQYIGSSAVRAYLHGFIVRYELYKKVNLASFTHLHTTHYMNYTFILCWIFL